MSNSQRARQRAFHDVVEVKCDYVSGINAQYLNLARIGIYPYPRAVPLYPYGYVDMSLYLRIINTINSLYYCLAQTHTAQNVKSLYPESFTESTDIMNPRDRSAMKEIFVSSRIVITYSVLYRSFYSTHALARLHTSTYYHIWHPKIIFFTTLLSLLNPS